VSRSPGPESGASVARLRALGRFGVLVAAVLVAAHDLVYLAAYGPRAQRILEEAGHGPTWVAVGVGALLGAAALAALTLHRSRMLRQRLIALGGPALAPLPVPQLVVRIGRLWMPLLAVSLVAFAVQENLEHLQHHGHVPGAAVLWSVGYEWALPIFAALTFAAAAVGSVALARIAALALAVARASRAIRRMMRPSWPITSDTWRTRQLRSVPDLGRAPPPLLPG
jgi:hypothetical protein